MVEIVSHTHVHHFAGIVGIEPSFYSTQCLRIEGRRGSNFGISNKAIGIAIETSGEGS